MSNTISTRMMCEVKIPFELKDKFKQHFQVASFFYANRSWLVPIEMAKEVQDFLSWHTSESWQLVELTEQTKWLNKTIKDVRKHTNATVSMIRNALEVKEKFAIALQESEHVEMLLKQKETELEILNTQIKTLEDSIEQKREQNKKVLEKIIDFESLVHHKEQMHLYHVKHDRTPEHYAFFEKSRFAIKEAQQKLREIGLASHGIDDLCNMNYNRPERNDYADVRDLEDMYSLDTGCKE